MPWQDVALEGEFIDVYPRGGVSDWLPAVQAAGLTGVFEAAFDVNWRELLLEHIADVSTRFPGVLQAEGCPINTGTDLLGPDFATWPHSQYSGWAC